MDFGGIVKRSWHITWRYKALWVLGIFAGVSGCQPGGGGGSGGGGNSGFDTGPGGRDPFSGITPSFDEILVWALIALGVITLLGIVWTVLSVAARGGLVVGVNEVEEGREKGLGELWGAGFSRWWRLFGLSLLLQLPILLVVLAVIAGVVLPLVGSSAFTGGEPGPEVIAPICGSLLIGLPLLLVLSLVLDILHLIAIRYVMLQGMRVFESVGAAWRLMRSRMKDTVLMYLLSGALNLAASFVLAIPAVVIGVAVALPMVVAIEQGRWETIVGPIVAAVIAIIALSLVYNAIWGTYTSALWTLFFRGAIAPVAPAPAVAATHPQYPPMPPAAQGYQPPVPPAAQGYQPPAPPAAQPPQPQPPVAYPPTPPAPQPEPPVSQPPVAPPADAPAASPAPPAPPSPPTEPAPPTEPDA